MAQIFHRSANSLSRVIIAAVLLMLGGVVLAAYNINSGAFITNVGVARDQPVPFSHKHHVGDDGIDCRYCHQFVETSDFAGLPPTETCMSCHSQIWTNAEILEPVRASFRSGESIAWTKVHDLPDFVYFNHSIHVNKGIGCESCHGRVDEMPLMYEQNTLQMEWCLNCHRNPAKNLRPTSQIYNMAWEAPAFDRPVWCATNEVKEGTPTAQGVSCTVKDPSGEGTQVAALQMPKSATTGQSAEAPAVEV